MDLIELMDEALIWEESLPNTSDEYKIERIVENKGCTIEEARQALNEVQRDLKRTN